MERLLLGCILRMIRWPVCMLGANRAGGGSGRDMVGF